MNNPVGRPKIYVEQDEPIQVRSVRLPFWHIRRAKRLGNGSLSQGIRQALETAPEPEKEKT